MFELIKYGWQDISRITLGSCTQIQACIHCSIESLYGAVVVHGNESRHPLNQVEFGRSYLSTPRRQQSSCPFNDALEKNAEVVHGTKKNDNHAVEQSRFSHG